MLFHFTSITEQPYKIPYTAALFSLLSLLPAPIPSKTMEGDEANPAAEGSSSVPASTSSPAQPLFQELCRAFQLALDRLAWRDLRLTVSFSQ